MPVNTKRKKAEAPSYKMRKSRVNIRSVKDVFNNFQTRSINCILLVSIILPPKNVNCFGCVLKVSCFRDDKKGGQGVWCFFTFVESASTAACGLTTNAPVQPLNSDP